MNTTYWLVLMIFQIGAIMLAYMLGGIHLVIEADKSYLSYAIFAVWLIASFISGYSIYKNQVGKNARIINLLADTCTAFGMVGTVVGFIMLMTVIDVNTIDSDNLKDSVVQMLAGFGTAMYTTLVGLLCYISIRHQIGGVE